MSLFFDMLHDPEDSFLVGDCLSDVEAMRRELYVVTEEGCRRRLTQGRAKTRVGRRKGGESESH